MWKHLNVIYVVYLNDIVIYSRNKIKHVKHVYKMLKVLMKAKLYTKLKKCNFNTHHVNFLSYIIMSNNVIIKKFKIEIILMWFESMCKRNIQIFIKFINFYYHFIYYFMKKIMKLIKLLKTFKLFKKKQKLLWNQKQFTKKKWTFLMKKINSFFLSWKRYLWKLC